MRGRYSKQATQLERMEIDQNMLNKQNKEAEMEVEGHHLSGAYIRSLVKQLTSSRTKDPMNTDCSVAAADGAGVRLQDQNLTQVGQGFVDTQQPQPQQKHKKQVRRRLHTSRPYQERLLNMAEARKEIVTALKYHRAAMKQAQDQQQQQQQQQEQPPPPQPQPPQIQPLPQPCFEPEAKIKSRRNPRIYPSNTSNFANYPNYHSFSHHQQPLPDQIPWSAAPQIAPPPIPENLNFTLPNQPLGLNLNFHDFSNLDTTLYHHHNNNINPSLIYSSPSSSSSQTLSCTIPAEDTSSAGIVQDVPQQNQHHPAGADQDDSSGGLHPAMDDEEMAEIRSIGEQHDMAWNDTMNLVTSAWWFKFLKSDEDMVDGYNPFGEVMQFPSWLNSSDNLGLQHNHYCSHQDYYQDPALPCMDIGEFEGMDGEWLS